VERQTIQSGRLALRPFDRADIPWVLEVSSDPAVQRFVEVPSPYRREHAAFFVEELAIAGWDSGRRAEFLVEDAATGRRFAGVGLGLRRGGLGGIGYWADPAGSRKRRASLSKRHCASG
jgi:RimJ/RimL family protein N-acetyltransferase